VRGIGGGAYDPTFELEKDFCTMHLSVKFHHRMCNDDVVTIKVADSIAP